MVSFTFGTTSFPRTGRISHDHSDASVLISIFAPAVRIINKTLSTDAAAWAVPLAIGPDRPGAHLGLGRSK